MAVFGSQEEAERILGDFMERVTQDPELRPKFVAAATSFRANYHDPDCFVSLDSTVDPPLVTRGDEAKARTVAVDLFMSTEDGHKFWLGQLNVMMALGRRTVRVQGQMAELLKLLPAIQPASGMYREFLTERGLGSTLDA